MMLGKHHLITRLLKLSLKSLVFRLLYLISQTSKRITLLVCLDVLIIVLYLSIKNYYQFLVFTKIQYEVVNVQFDEFLHQDEMRSDELLTFHFIFL